MGLGNPIPSGGETIPQASDLLDASLDLNLDLHFVWIRIWIWDINFEFGFNLEL